MFKGKKLNAAIANANRSKELHAVCFQKLTDAFEYRNQVREDIIEKVYVPLDSLFGQLNIHDDQTEITKRLKASMSSLLQRTNESAKISESNLKEMEESGRAAVLSLAAAGVLTGAAVSTYGGTVLIAIAKTYGTTLAGKAIGSIGNAANQTAAALAWLGRFFPFGAKKGVEQGARVVSSAGPVGWAIAAAVVIGTGTYLWWKNKSELERVEEINKQFIETNDKIHLDICQIQQDVNNVNKEIVKVEMLLESIKIAKENNEDNKTIAKLVRRLSSAMSEINMFMHYKYL